jgi:hypothetical protein
MGFLSVAHPLRGSIMQLSIKTNFPEVQKALGELQKDIGRTAAASALNKVVAQAKTAMAREMRSEFVIASDKVNGALSITRASATGSENRMQASLQALRKGRRSGGKRRAMRWRTM